MTVVRDSGWVKEIGVRHSLQARPADPQAYGEHRGFRWVVWARCSLLASCRQVLLIFLPVLYVSPEKLILAIPELIPGTLEVKLYWVPLPFLLK